MRSISGTVKTAQPMRWAHLLLSPSSSLEASVKIQTTILKNKDLSLIYSYHISAKVFNIYLVVSKQVHPSMNLDPSKISFLFAKVSSTPEFLRLNSHPSLLTRVMLSSWRPKRESTSGKDLKLTQLKEEKLSSMPIR